MQKVFYLYILSNQNHTVLAMGLTTNLKGLVVQALPKSKAAARVRTGSGPEKARILKLVYYQAFATQAEALAKEREIKAESLEQKLRRISAHNPTWQDLYAEI